jgi:hypothetical protein
MAGFSLTQAGDKYDFDLLGTVNKGGSRVGTWATDKSNKIVLTKDNNAGQLAFDVGWKFDQNNQLSITSGGQALFNFHSVSANRPFYAAVNAVLKVRPDQNHTFGFDLHGEWDIDANHDLTITINGVTSVLDGYVQDARSRFMYHFFNKQNLMQESILGFVGQWDFVNDNGSPKLDFKYAREDGSTDTFSLPQGVTVNRSINQFMYSYDKAGQTRTIQFVGMLKVSPDFQLTYSIDRQVSQSGQQQVAQTTFTIGATFKKTNFSGDIEFVLKKTDGTAGTTTIGLSGNFTATLGSTQLQAAFSFTQTRGANVVTTTFAFNGSLKFGQGGQIQWSFEKNAQNTVITISATDIKLGNARLDARLNIVAQDGHVSGIFFFLGVAF